MPRYDRSDILMELIELCRDIKSDILQQLNYYRASVYKSETAQQIEGRVAQMRTIAELCGSDLLLDAFHDYDEMKKDGLRFAVPGECLLSHRVARLFQTTDRVFEEILENLHQPNPQDGQQLTRNIQRHRRQLLSMCKMGTRQWAFFNAL